MTGLELLTTDEMRRADELAAAAGVPSLTLMENAGRSVADAVETLATPGARIAILCGPGNNGGDGFVAARHLKERGHGVRVALVGHRDALKGDAAEMAGRWSGRVLPLAPAVLEEADVIVDALFGAGLTRPLDGAVAVMVEAANASGRPILAVDVPSGLDGTTGAAAGPVIRATRTITFFRRKTGHVLLPGRLLCGEVTVADIGIPEQVLDEIRPQTVANAPILWRAVFPWPHDGGHKYDRGHAVAVSGGPDSTGAARLGARGALRIGAGLVTVASPREALVVNAAHLTAIMVRAFDRPDGLAEILADRRRNAVLLGPGAGVGEETRAMVRIVLASGAAAVLDADAITSFAGGRDDLAVAIAANPARPVVLTPHEGEFHRLFDDTMERGSKVDRARQAARASGAVIVLKGTDTVIAAPDGPTAINENAPATLATAGSGDVLGGMITGLLAQRMLAFEAACAAVWLHGAAAQAFGPGLIAEDLPEMLPKVLAGPLEASGVNAS